VKHFVIIIAMCSRTVACEHEVQNTCTLYQYTQSSDLPVVSYVIDNKLLRIVLSIHHTACI